MAELPPSPYGILGEKHLAKSGGKNRQIVFDKIIPFPKFGNGKGMDIILDQRWGYRRLEKNTLSSGHCPFDLKRVWILDQ